MRIAIIGAGNVGKTLGQGWAGAGHEIVYGARDGGGPAPHAGARVDSVQGATAAGDVVVLTTPWDAVPDAVAAAGDFAGKPLIDVTNPIGPGFALTLGHRTSGAERVASLAKNARVVKAFNTTGLENMANPRYGDARAMMPIAGDDRGAVDVAARLASDLGFEPFALPALARARELEPLAMLWIKLALQWGMGRGFALAVGRRSPAERMPDVPRTKQPRAITVVGSGNIGGALARAWLSAGHAVTIAAKDPAEAGVQALVALGAKAVPVAGAAAGAEIVALATPASVAGEVARELGRLEGTIVVDCTNAIAKGFSLEHGHTTSSSEELAKGLGGARVVRAFNQQGAEVLRNPLFGGRPAACFVASDDADARFVVRGLAADVGLDGIEAGPLSSARLLEPMTLVWIAMAQAIGTRDFGFCVLRR